MVGVLMIGRPHEYDDLKAQRILRAIRNGVGRRCAAKAAGIWPSTLYDWLARGKKGEAPFADFAERIRHADAEVEEEMALVVLNAARAESWQAALAWLHTRRPQSWPTLAPRKGKEDQKADAREATDDELLAAVQGELERRKRKAHG